MHVNFSEQLAIDFDLEVEYFLRNVAVWLCINASKDNPEYRNLREGEYWSYNSYPEYAKLIPVFSKKQIRTITSRAVKGGLLKISNFNKKKYDNTNWYTLTEKGWTYFTREAEKLYPDWFVNSGNADSHLDTPAQMGRPPAQMGRPIPLKPNSLGNNIIISDLDEKSDYLSNCEEEDFGCSESHICTGFEPKSDYQSNQSKKESDLLRNEHILRKRDNISSNAHKAIKNQQIIDAYHETLPDCPKIKVIDSKLDKQLNHMKQNWPRYQKEGRSFSIDSFKDYLNYIKQFFPWFIKPYVTQNGNTKRNNLRVLTREINITKIVNGEFSVN